MEADAELNGWNYFNYFTEIEEHFQRTRGTGLFLLSPVDWALIEPGRTAEFPLKQYFEALNRPLQNGREEDQCQASKLARLLRTSRAGGSRSYGQGRRPTEARAG
jgi:hypothetical protein